MNTKTYSLKRGLSVIHEKRRVVSPERFIKIIRNNRSSIERTSFVPPKLGSEEMGKFVIHYK